MTTSQDHGGVMRSPDEILKDFDDGCKGLADIDMRGVLWEVIDDLRDTTERVLQRHCPSSVRTVMAEVEDYLVNNYGDD